MGFIGFKTPKPRQFNYRPLFYDKQEDEFEQKLRKIRENAPEDSASKLRKQMDETWKRRKTIPKKNKSLKSLLIAIAILLMLLYLVFFM